MNRLIIKVIACITTILWFSVSQPVYAAGELDIQVIGGEDKPSSNVIASGKIVQIVTDKDRRLFKIDNANLKSAVEKFFGKRPKDVFVKSPTPWNDLYKTYNWPQVQRVLKVHDAKILEIDAKPEVLAENELVNHSKKTGTFNASLTTNVTNEVHHEWHKSDTIGFDVKIDSGEVSGELGIEEGIIGKLGIRLAKTELGFRYEHTWGSSHGDSHQTSIGTAQGVEVTLDPGEKVLAQLIASKGTMKVRITYEVSLIGYTAVNYYPRYKGHHFWAFPINEVMKAAGLSNSVRVVEDINISFYSKGRIVLSPGS